MTLRQQLSLWQKLLTLFFRAGIVIVIALQVLLLFWIHKGVTMGGSILAARDRDSVATTEMRALQRQMKASTDTLLASDRRRDLEALERARGMRRLIRLAEARLRTEVSHVADSVVVKTTAPPRKRGR